MWNIPYYITFTPESPDGPGGPALPGRPGSPYRQTESLTTDWMDDGL